MQKNACNDQSPILITREEAANRYSCSLRMIDNLLAEGFLPSVKLSKRFRRVPVKEADAAMLGKSWEDSPAPSVRTKSIRRGSMSARL